MSFSIDLDCNRRYCMAELVLRFVRKITHPLLVEVAVDVVMVVVLVGVVVVVVWWYWW